MFAWFALTLAVAAPSPAAAPAPAASAAPSEAVALEERAFAAIDSEQWCLAMRLFERAHDVAPAVGLVQNAARAAEFGNDLASAVRLHAAIAADPGATKAVRTAASKKVAELQKRLTSSGPVCAALEVLAPPTPSTPVVEPPTSTDVSTASPPDRPGRDAPSHNTGPLGAVLTGTGGVLLAGGVVTTVVGLVPWFAHADAAGRVNAAELARADATAAQQDQAQARADWEGYGQLATTVGSVVTGVGLAVLAGGVVVLLTTPADADHESDNDHEHTTEESR